MTSERRNPPTKCDACQSINIVYGTESEILKTFNRLWPFIYHCRDCKASVGCHNGTNRPLGFMATPYVRSLRAQLHDIIDPIWKSGFATRTQIYTWIAKELSIDYEFCHISQLGISQLKIAIEFCGTYVEANVDRIKKAEQNRDRQHERTKERYVNSDRRIHPQSIHLRDGRRTRRTRRTDTERY